MRDGITRIAKERIRQKQEKEWTREHDLAYTEEQLRKAAAVYALPEEMRDVEVIISHQEGKDGPHTITTSLRRYVWPWKEKWWKPNSEHPERDLEKAGALIAAELDRRQETIRCAAIHFKHSSLHTPDHGPKNIEQGIVVTGHRHSSCFENSRFMTLSRQEGNYVEGFLTSHNRFVDRSEAAEIAYKAGQIYTKIGTLYSEDLY